ncbi:MAG: BF3164 family lipoprotein [Bacteroidales bacterium]|nr:BF3164 family lipoprotein [Bacteroidales bacterium]
MKKLFSSMMILLILFLLNGCKEKSLNKYLDFNDLFSVKDTLKGVILEKTSSQDSAKYSSFLYSPNGLIVDVGLENEAFFMLDTLTGGKIASGGLIGRGHNEILSIISFDYNSATNKLFVWDIYQKKIHSFDVSKDKILKVARSIDVKEKSNLYRLKVISDSLFIALSFCPDQTIGLISNNGTFISKLPYKVIENNNINYTTKYFNTQIAVSPKKDYIVAVDFMFPSIKLYSIKDNKILPKWGKMVFKPLYNIENGWVKINNDQPFGFLDVFMTKKFIYVSSLGLKCGDWRENKNENSTYTYLLKFDYNGKFINSYILDHYIQVFEFGSDGKTIYGLCGDNKIFKYSITD